MADRKQKFARFVFACAAVFVASGRHGARASDNLLACEKSDGTEYYVDANLEHCAPGDDTTRCILPDNVVHVRYVDATTECKRRGGHLLGQPPTQKQE